MTYSSKEMGGTPHHIRLHEEAPGSVWNQKKQVRSWPRAFIVVPLGRNGQGRVGKFELLRIASLNVSKLWAVGVVPGCPVPGPGVI